MTLPFALPDFEVVNGPAYALGLEDIIPGKPGDVVHAATEARKLRNKMSNAHDILNRVRDVRWSGEAAANFRTVQTQLLSQTRHLGTRLETLAGTLNGFVGHYVSAKNTGRQLAGEIKDHRHRMNALAREILAEVATVPASGVVDTVKQVLGDGDGIAGRIHRIEGMIHDWQGQLATLEGLVGDAKKLRKNFDHAAKDVSKHIETLNKSDGPGGGFGFWQAITGGPGLDQVRNLIDDHPVILNFGATAIGNMSDALGFAGGILDVVFPPAGLALNVASGATAVLGAEATTELAYSGARDQQGNLYADGNDATGEWIGAGLSIIPVLGAGGKAAKRLSKGEEPFEKPGGIVEWAKSRPKAIAEGKAKAGWAGAVNGLLGLPPNAKPHDAVNALIPNEIYHYQHIPRTHTDLRPTDVPDGYEHTPRSRLDKLIDRADQASDKGNEWQHRHITSPLEHALGKGADYAGQTIGTWGEHGIGLP